MKVLCAEYNSRGEVAVIPVGDDVLLRNNDDFYIPQFTDRVSCIPQLVVRICKLGKSVPERFAGRYYEEIGVGIRFYADDFEQSLKEKELPVVMASSFAGSAAISALVSRQEVAPAEYTFWVNGVPCYAGSQALLPWSMDKLIALASDFHILKIGDFLYSGNQFRYTGLQLGDRIQVFLNGREWMDFKIK